MKLAVTSTGTNLDDLVDPRFGRCACFIIVETEDMSFNAITNNNSAAGGGAGIQSAQLVAEQDANVVLTGNCGPNAFRTLEAAGIDVITNIKGSVRDAVEHYKTGSLSATNGPNVSSHAGMTP
ncbi:MAG: NifB/NifX family molybdenum-iron cluster-binding protein [Kiritimatiellae bacterium]|nr:NifB/NifX family molybdenum-iron cluster-binding protein [Kiritimatiellia bacterium]